MAGLAARLRGLALALIMYPAMAGFALWWLPATLRRPDGALDAVKAYARFAMAAARVIAGIRTELRGTVPSGGVLIAAKHQSFLDILILTVVLERPRFIMKRELTRTPFIGWYALRIGCIPVDRGRRDKAVRQMLSGVAAGREAPGQVVIYPQGTRVAPGDKAPYKAGAGALYREMGQSCVPVATNVGLLWPRNGVIRRPGRAVVEFLDPIPPGLTTEAFMARLEDVIETRSDRLIRDGRGG